VRGYLKINRLRVDAVVGIYDWEQTQKQPLYLDLELAVDFNKAAETDNIGDALDYEQLAKELTELIEVSRLQLIESIAHEVVHYLIKRYGIHYGKVQLTKPRALGAAEEVAIMVEFGQK
jgi:7,8-dihydroneopterin aldolase/epimerase/oxygenase